MDKHDLPVLGFAAFSGTGKTTLLLKLLPLLQARGHRIGIVKHAHHTFEIDHTGKDSYALRKSGAQQIIVGSKLRWALVCEHGDEGEPSVAELIDALKTETLDLILVEGFKHEAIPKIELYRAALGHPMLFPNDSDIVAIAHDAKLATPAGIPELDLNNADEIADFVARFAQLHATRTSECDMYSDE